MLNYLYAFSAPLGGWDPETNPKPGDLVLVEQRDGYYIYLTGHELEGAADQLLGIWDHRGRAIGDVAAFKALNPVGNVDGYASGAYPYHNWQGHVMRAQQASPAVGTLPQYPEDNQPIVLTVTRRWYSTPAPNQSGWVFDCTIRFADPDRAPTARRVGLYTDDTYSDKIVDTGAFVPKQDEDGNTVWTTSLPPAQATPDREDLYLALQVVDVIEGKMFVQAGATSKTGYFWVSDRSPPAVTPPGL